MTLLFICHEYPPFLSGGIGIFVKSLAEELVRNNHHCMVAGLYPIPYNKEEEMEGVKIFRFAMKKKRYPLPAMNRWYEVKRKKRMSTIVTALEKKIKPDLIESFEWSGPLYHKPQTKLLVRLHGSHSAHALLEKKPLNPFLFFWEKKNYKMADARVAVSEYMKTATENCFGKEGYTRVIYNPLNALFQQSEGTGMRKEYRILFVGKFHERKGVYELAQILNELLPLHSQYEFVFAGHHTPDQQRTFLQWIRPELQTRVSFLQAMPQRELKEIYESSSLMIMPTHAEAFGLTAIEAMACGCLVAMNDVASAREIIEEEVTGLLIDIQNAKQSAIRINQLMNAERRHSMREVAREKVFQTFGMKTIVQKNIDLYESLLSS